MGNITINSNITGGGGGAPGGSVGGGSNLTTVGAIPYVSASGVLNQDPTALFWDAANNRLGVGTASPAYAISIVGTSPVYLQIQGSGSNSYLGMAAGVQTMQADAAIAFRPNSTESARFAATTGNLLIGTTTDDGTNKLQVAGTAIVNLKAILKGSGASRSESAVIFSDSTGAEGSRRGAIGSEWFTTSGQYGLEFVTAGSLRGGIAYTSGNLIWGSSTYVDNGFKLDVAASGSAGTARFYGGAGVSDTTKVVVRAGAGQSTTNLTEWQDSSGTIVAQFKPSDYRFTIGVLAGGTYQSSFRAIDFEAWYGTQSPLTGPISQRAMLIGGNAAGLRVASDYGMYWSANAAGSGDAYGSLDTGLSRNAAGVIEVNNGTAGTYRDLILRRSQHNGVTVAALPAAAAGNAGSIQYVTDANATTIGSTVAGGGANKVMVWSDGAAWKIFAS